MNKFKKLLILLALFFPLLIFVLIDFCVRMFCRILLKIAIFLATIRGRFCLFNFTIKCIIFLVDRISSFLSFLDEKGYNIIERIGVLEDETL